MNEYKSYYFPMICDLQQSISCNFLSLHCISDMNNREFCQQPLDVTRTRCLLIIGIILSFKVSIKWP